MECRFGADSAGRQLLETAGRRPRSNLKPSTARQMGEAEEEPEEEEEEAVESEDEEEK